MKRVVEKVERACFGASSEEKCWEPLISVFTVDEVEKDVGTVWLTVGLAHLAHKVDQPSVHIVQVEPAKAALPFGGLIFHDRRCRCRRRRRRR